MASIFDVLTNGALGSVIDSITKGGIGGMGGAGGLGSSVGDVLSSLGQKAKQAGRDLRDNTPGGLGGLAGAGALGALLGNVLQGDLMKSVAMAGAGAVAWNFYKKWAAQHQGNAQGQGSAPNQAVSSDQQGEMPAGWGGASAAPANVDPTAELVTRAMIYAARSDGNIDAQEQQRIEEILHTMLPNQDTSGLIQRIRVEMIDPNKIAVAVGSPEQAEDVYRLSCSVIDIDHFMEEGYLQALAKSLGINDTKKKQLEAEATQAKQQLRASIGQ